jgi:hypothetical protein
MFRSVADYPTVRDAWAAMEPGDTLDVPPGLWDVEPHETGYPALRADRDDIAVRLAPGAVLRLRPGGVDGVVIGGNGRSGSRRGLTIYGGGQILSWSTTYPAVLWSSQLSGATLTDLTLDGVEVVGGQDSLYVGARSQGTTLVRGCALRHPHRYALGVGKGAGGVLRVERTHLDRPAIASAVPHALHIESEGTPIRVEVADHSTADASLSYNGASGGWLAEDIVLRDGVVMASSAPGGVVRRAAVRWRRPPAATPRAILLTGDCSGAVLEDVVVDNEPAELADDDRPAVVASLSTGVTLRRARILSAVAPQPSGLTPEMVVGPGYAYVLGPGAVLDDVRVVEVPR